MMDDNLNQVSPFRDLPEIDSSNFLSGVRTRRINQPLFPGRMSDPLKKAAEPLEEDNYIPQLEKMNVKDLFELLKEVTLSNFGNSISNLNENGDQAIVSPELHPFNIENRKLLFGYIIKRITKILSQYLLHFKNKKDFAQNLPDFLSILRTRERLRNHLYSFCKIKNEVVLQKSLVLEILNRIKVSLNGYMHYFHGDSEENTLKRRVFKCEVMEGSEEHGVTFCLMNDYLSFSLTEPGSLSLNEKWKFDVERVSVSPDLNIEFSPENVKEMEVFFNQGNFEYFEKAVVSYFRKKLFIHQFNISPKNSEFLTQNNDVDLELYTIGKGKTKKKELFFVWNLEHEIILSSWFVEKTNGLGFRNVQLSGSRYYAQNFQNTKIGTDMKILLLGIQKEKEEDRGNLKIPKYRNQVFSYFNNKYLFFTKLEDSEQRQLVRGIKCRRIMIKKIDPEEFENTKVQINRNIVFNKLFKSCFKNFSRIRPKMEGFGGNEEKDGVSIEVSVQDPFCIFLIIFFESSKVMNLKFFVKEDGLVDINEMNSRDNILSNDDKNKGCDILNRYQDIPLFIHFVFENMRSSSDN